MTGKLVRAANRARASIALKAGGAEVAKIGVSGAVDWTRLDLKPAAAGSSA